MWSDSQCVRHWINSDTVSDIFVKNRIKEIKSHTGVEFRYVPTKDNPADLSSRGCSMETLTTSKIWWSGPPWLVNDTSVWPTNIDRSYSQKTNDDLKADLSQAILAWNSIDIDCIIPIERYSSLTRLLRVTAWMKRVMNNCRRQRACRQFGELTADELSKAQLLCDLNVQRNRFGDILQQSNKQEYTKVKHLDIFKDDNGFIRCGGRFQFADVDEEAKCPILLPKNDHYTDLIIKDYHEKLFHSTAYTFASAPKILDNSRKITGRTCTKKLSEMQQIHGGAFRIPPSPSLPEFRVTCQRPFSTVGIDYLGPLYVMPKKSGEPRSKVWICLFTCAAIRAVHLEVVENLTTEDFLMASVDFVQYIANLT